RRRSSLALADRIAVLDGGRIVDIGTHDELRARCTHYRTVLQDHPAESTAQPPVPVASPVGAARAAVPARRSASAPEAASATRMRAQLAALPPATDTPDIDEDAAVRDLTGTAGRPFGLRHLLRGFWLPVFLGLALVVADALAALALPFAMRNGIDGGTRRLALDAVWTASLVCFALVLTQYVVQWAAIRVTGRTGERLLYALRLRVFAHVHRLGLDHFEKEAAGRTMTRMTADVDSLSSFLQTGLVSVLVSALTLVGLLVALCIADV